MQTTTDPRVAEVEALAPNPHDLFDGFLSTASRKGNSPALRAGASGEWIMWDELAAEVDRAARAFIALGVEPGEPVALMLRNRPEFHVLDTALLSIGAIPFSVYNTSSPPQIRQLLTDSSGRLVIAEADHAARAVAAGIGGARVFSLDPTDGDGVSSWESALAAGDPSYDLSARRAAIEPDSVATIIYTSGTTGTPKGVQLTHTNLLWMARMLPVLWGMHDEEQALLSYLPMAHIAERIFTYYVPLLWGWPVTCCDEPQKAGAALPSVEPSIFFAPPRFWEKLQAAAYAGPLSRPEAQAALARGLELVKAQQAGEDVREDHAPIVAQFAPLRRAFGFGRLTCGMVATANVPPPLIEFWRAVGVNLVEGYGLSETSGGVCFDDPQDSRIGSVGVPLPGVETRVAEDAELLVRSPSVTIGYRNRPEQTADAIDADGWLHTGDLVTVDDDGRVRIVDRKKDIIIGSGGHNMSPTMIEGALKSSSPLIGQAICIGESRPYNVALLVLDPENAGLPLAEAARDAGIRAKVEEAVARANAQLSRVEQIKRFAILGSDWLPDSDELTPTMKIKRKPIAAKYAAVIESLYA